MIRKVAHNVFVPLDKMDLDHDQSERGNGPVEWLTDHGVIHYECHVDNDQQSVWFGFLEGIDRDILMLFKLTWAGT